MGSLRGLPISFGKITCVGLFHLIDFSRIFWEAERMKALLHIADILRSSKQRQFAIFSKILYVISNNDITASSNSTLILKHILKIFARLVNGIT